MRQVTPRRDGHKQAATARRLLTSTAIAPHVLRETVEATFNQRVVRRRATEPVMAGHVLVAAGEYYFLVASSKFVGRFYLVSSDLACSSTNGAIAENCRKQVIAHVAYLLQLKKAIA